MTDTEKTFGLEILTPKGEVFAGQVTSLIAPGAMGYLGILVNHAPLVTTLTEGRAVYQDPQGAATTIQCKGTGFLEVRDNHVTLLTDEVAA